LAFQEDTVLTQINIEDSSQNTVVKSYYSWDDSLQNADSTVFESLYNFNQKNSEYAKAIKPLFTEKQDTPNNISPIGRSVINIDWITIHLLISLCLIAYVQIYYSKRFKQVINAFLGNRYMHMLTKDGNIYRERISIPLVIVYLISFSLLMFLLITQYVYQPVFNLQGLKLFSVIILAVIITWFIKNLMINFVGNLFKNYLILTDYIHTNFVFNMVIGVILMPIVIIAVFLPSVLMIYIGVIVWLAVYLYRIIRQVFTGLYYTKFSLFYRILYLCTFEIIPLLVLTKLVMSLLS
jgi:hypothetical protein